MKIREFVSGDTEKFVEIWFEASRSVHWFIGDDLLKMQKEEVRNEYIPMAETWVAEDGGEVMGFISLIDNYIGALFVHQRQQGKGAGTGIIKWASSEKDQLTVGVDEKNSKAQEFDKGLDFKETGREVQAEKSKKVINMKLTC